MRFFSLVFPSCYSFCKRSVTFSPRDYSSGEIGRRVFRTEQILAGLGGGGAGIFICRDRNGQRRADEIWVTDGKELAFVVRHIGSWVTV